MHVWIDNIAAGKKLGSETLSVELRGRTPSCTEHCSFSTTGERFFGKQIVNGNLTDEERVEI
jgi:hypothetical protein